MITLRQTLSFIIGMMALIFLAQAATAASARSATPAKMSERKTLREARVAFEKKQFSKAVRLYEAIPQASDYWIEALEERAWSHVHLKEHDKALGLLKTLFAPPIVSEIGAEPYLLSSLIQLRLCNYNELFKGLKQFKTDIRPRFESLEALAKDGETEESVKMLGRSMEVGQLSRASAGVDLPMLPRLFYRDVKLQQSFKKLLKASTPKAQSTLDAAVKSRMKSLAQRDVKDMQTILRRLHLVEVESVSRMYSQVHLADNKKTSPAIDRNANTLVFPDDRDDVWLDELDSYHVNSKGCPTADFVASKGL